VKTALHGAEWTPSEWSVVMSWLWYAQSNSQWSCRDCDMLRVTVSGHVVIVICLE